MATVHSTPSCARDIRVLATWIIRVSGHLDLCISRMELEVILTPRRNLPPLCS